MSRPAGGGGSVSTPPPTTPTTPTDPSAYYTQLLQQDPGFLALQQSLSAANQQNAAVRNAGIAQALIHFGMIPDLSQAASLGISPSDLAAIETAITPQVRALAQQNTTSGLSTEAQLQQQEHQAMLGLRNNLAARGALSSGDDAYRTNLQQQSYAQAQNNALQTLLGALGGYQQNYLNSYQAGQNQLAQAIPGLVSNLVTEYPNGPTAPHAAAHAVSHPVSHPSFASAAASGALPSIYSALH